MIDFKMTLQADTLVCDTARVAFGNPIRIMTITVN